MKLQPENLAAHLDRLPHIVLVSGDEPLQSNEVCDAIRERARGLGFAERELYVAERGFDWQSLRMASRSLSLFAARKLIELRLQGVKLDAAAVETIVELAESPTADTLVLLICEKLDARAQNAKWVTAIERAGWFVQVWPIERPRLPAWIRSRLARHGLQADDDVPALIADRVEGNLLAAHQEIEKLALLYPKDTLDAAAVLAAVTDSARYDVLQIGVAAMSGQAARALRILEGLRAEGVDATVVLWGINKDLQWLARVAHLVRRGEGVDAALNAEYVWRPRQPAMKQALSRLKLPALLALLRDAAYIDRLIKGARKGDPWVELQALVARLAGVQLRRAAYGF